MAMTTHEAAANHNAKRGNDFLEKPECDASKNKAVLLPESAYWM
jgi:hypothetical protein